MSRAEAAAALRKRIRERLELEAPKPRKRPKFNASKSRQDYRTPPEFIAAVEERFGWIGWDLACTGKNVVGSSKRGFFYDDGVDALALDWARELKPAHGVLHWLNPPFRETAKWVGKVAETAAACPSFRAVVLAPASIDSEWFRDHVDGKAYVMGVNPRLRFVGESDPYPGSLMLLHYGFGFAGASPWRWR